jgi:hypothetical protein
MELERCEVYIDVVVVCEVYIDVVVGTGRYRSPVLQPGSGLRRGAGGQHQR